MQGKPSPSLFHRLAWLGLLALAVSACSLQPPVQRSDAEVQRLWAARQTHLQRLQSWNVSGRLAIHAKDEGWHIAFRWQQQDRLYHIVLTNPLGQTSAELQGRPNGVTLLLADGRTLTAATPDELLARQGWPVPIQGLYYWVRGLPVPNAAETHGLDQQGRLQWLKQSGWQISYRRYGDVGDMDLPTKIFLDNDRLKVRLVISGWV